MKMCCKNLLEAIKIVQEQRISCLAKQLEIIEGKRKKAEKELRMIVILRCWKREAEIFLGILKEIKI